MSAPQRPTPGNVQPAQPADGAGAREGETAPALDLAALYQRAPVGLCLVDRGLRYLHANDAYAAIVGRPVEDLVGRSMEEVIPASARQGAALAASRVIESGDPVLGLELRREIPGDPEGTRVWLVNIHPVWRDGEVTGATAVLQNVTEIRRAEEEARAALSELESIYRGAPVGLSFVDAELRYLRVNQAIADLNGCSVEEMVGKTYRDLSPETADLAEPFLRRLMESGKPIRNVETVSRPPADRGREHHFLLSMDPVRDPAGRVVGHTSAVQDVTELRVAQEMAARRLAELEILYAHTPVGLCHSDRELRVVHLNPRFRHLSGAPPGELAGARLRDVLPESFAAELLPQLEYVLRSGASSANLRVHGVGPDGLQRICVAHTHATRAGDGSVSGLVTVLQDVTRYADREREAERLAESQQMVRLGSFEWDMVADRVWWSREMYVIAGQPPGYVPTSASFFDSVHADDLERVRAQVDRALGDGDASPMAFRIVRPDGSLREVFGVARIDRDEAGFAARMVGTWQDVTGLGVGPSLLRLVSRDDSISS